MDSNDENTLNISRQKLKAEKEVTIKSKFESIKTNMAAAYEEIKNYIKELELLKKEEESHNENLHIKTEKIKEDLLLELKNVEQKMAEHLEKQRADNTRLQKLITNLKGEKTVLMNKLIALQRRISDMEAQVGSEDLKFL